MSWAAQEFAQVDLGDSRLNERLIKTGELLSRAPQASIPEVCQDLASTKGAYRLFSNKRVTSDAILFAHAEQTLARCAAERVVLCLGDTTDVNLSRDCPADGVGAMSCASMSGFYAHVLLAVTPERRHLGVLQTQWMVRDRATIGQRAAQRKKLPITEKESYRWVKDFDHIGGLAQQATATRFVYIADRESDVYELLCAARRSSVDLVIRCKSNRSLIDGSHVHEEISQAPIIGTVPVAIPRARQREERDAVLALRVKTVILRPPFRKGEHHEPLTINVLEATEINTKKGIEPVSWILYTFCPIDTIDQALTILHWYICRWQIENYFRILKEGCGIELLRLDHLVRLKNAIALYMVIAWRIMHLMSTARQYPDAPCIQIVEPHEWTLAWILWHKKPPPRKPPTNRDIVRLIAQLGGFLARKSDGEPGAKTIWRGLEKLRTMIDASNALQAVQSKRRRRKDVGNE
jgi:Transposase Tn5 dimerisation domain/Transposase DNA-binding